MMETDLYFTATESRASTLGFVWQMFRNPLSALSNLARENGDIARVKLRRREIFLLNHPDFIEQVLVKQSHNFIKGPSLQRARIILGSGLLTSEGDEHLAQRRALQPAFHRQNTEKYIHLMAGQTMQHIHPWHTGQRVEISDQMMRLTLDIALWAFFGGAFGDEAGKVDKSMSTLMKLFPLTQLPLPDSAQNLFPSFAEANASLRTVTASLLRNPRSSVAQAALLDILKKNSGATFTDEEMHAHALTFLLAGHETTALLLAWCWDMLANNPFVQGKLQAEVDYVLGYKLPLPADIESLPYTRRVILETLRMRPPAWTIGRQAVNDCEIGGQRIPAGSVVLVSQWVMHHDPRYYADPQEFNPDRWIDIEKNSFPRYAFFPFGGGSRVCIGEHFAMTEAIAVLAIISRRWQMHSVLGRPASPQPSVTLRPRQGIPLVIERRNI